MSQIYHAGKRTNYCTISKVLTIRIRRQIGKLLWRQQCRKAHHQQEYSESKKIIENH